MDNIEQKLAQLDLGVDDLPQNIKKLIEALDYQAHKLEQQIEEYESSGEKNEELETKFNEQYSVLESKEAFVISKIEEFKASQTEEKPKETEKVATDESKTDEPKPKKKGLGIGSIILGVAVLAITMGAVNTMRSK